MTAPEIADGTYAWPDAEAVVVAGLSVLAPAYTDTPPNLGTERAFRVLRTGGPDDSITDYPLIEITTYGQGTTPRADAWELAGKARELLLAARGTVMGGALVDDVRTSTPPQQIPEINQDLRSVTHSYTLAFRRQRVSD